MKQIVQHPTYGQILYEESFWTGKKSLTVNGVRAGAVSKKEFMLDGRTVTLKGSYLSGVTLLCDGAEIEIMAKPKWYELALAFLPLIFIMVWGNNATLVSVFPIIGGAIGGLIGGVGAVSSLMLMKKADSASRKLLIGSGLFLASVFVAWITGITAITIIAMLI